MHLYIFTRGQFDKVRDMMNDLQAQFLNYKTGITPQDNKIVQLGVRPIQLWEIAFPEECLETVMRTIGPMEGFQRKNDKRPIMKMMRMILKLKKYLGLKDVPKIDYTKGPRGIIRRIDTDVKAVGLKEDKKQEIEQI